jgi:PiT family inorganic phosphate transporter
VGRRGAEVRWSVARKMVFAWLLTLPGAGLVGGLAALLANYGTPGVIALLVLLAVACSLIWSFSRRHRVSHHNVTDSPEVLVLASAKHVGDRGVAASKPKQKVKKHKAKSAA